MVDATTRPILVLLHEKFSKTELSRVWHRQLPIKIVGLIAFRPFLWRHVKDCVAEYNSFMLEYLKQNIRKFIARIPTEM